MTSRTRAASRPAPRTNFPVSSSTSAAVGLRAGAVVSVAGHGRGRRRPVNGSARLPLAVMDKNTPTACSRTPKQPVAVAWRRRASCDDLYLVSGVIWYVHGAGLNHILRYSPVSAAVTLAPILASGRAGRVQLKAIPPWIGPSPALQWPARHLIGLAGLAAV